MLIRFILTLISTAVVVSGTSLAWPRFTTAPRPKPLEQFHNAVVQTPVGAQLEQVLGTSDNKINLTEQIKNTAGQVITNATKVVEEKTKEIVTNRIVDQLITEWNTISPETQKELKETICK